MLKQGLMLKQHRREQQVRPEWAWKAILQGRQRAAKCGTREPGVMGESCRVPIGPEAHLAPSGADDILRIAADAPPPCADGHQVQRLGKEHGHHRVQQLASRTLPQFHFDRT